MTRSTRYSVIIGLICIFIISVGCTPGRSLTKREARNDSRYDDEYSEESNDFEDDDRTYSRSRRDRDNQDEDSRDRSRRNRDSRESGYIEDDYDDGDSSEASYRKEKFFQTGMASWYGREFHGKTTASGEKFNMHSLTAAHKTLPFGTVVVIKNLDTGQKVTVKINDRGPYRGKRIIDLSYKAAKKLGIVRKGKAYVGIKILRKGNNRYARNRKWYENERKEKEIEPVSDDEVSDYEEFEEKDTREDGNYSIQAGAFYSRRNAEKLKRRLERMTNGKVRVVHDDDLYKVRIEGIMNRRSVQNYKRILSEEDIPSYIINNSE